MAHRYLSTAEQNLILTKVAAYVAGCIGFNYSLPTEDTYSHKLIGPDEAVLYISVIGDTNGDRINISGGFHIGRTKWGNSEFVRPKSGVPSDITIALSRGNEVIAHEIKARYLPGYLVALAEARTQRDADQAYIVKQGASLSRLALLAGSRTPDLQSHSVYLNIGEIHGAIEAYGDSITLNMHRLTMKQAEAVIKLLRK